MIHFTQVKLAALVKVMRKQRQHRHRIQLYLRRSLFESIVNIHHFVLSRSQRFTSLSFVKRASCSSRKLGSRCQRISDSTSFIQKSTECSVWCVLSLHKHDLVDQSLPETFNSRSSRDFYSCSAALRRSFLLVISGSCDCFCLTCAGGMVCSTLTR